MPTDLPSRAATDDLDAVREVRITRYREGYWTEEADDVAAEEPFEVQVAGQSVAVIMRTPGNDRYLAAGFLVGEGIIRSREDIRAVEAGLDRDGFPQPNALDLHLRPDLEGSDRLRQRNFYVSSSCGLCGVASIEAVRLLAPPVAVAGKIGASTVLRLETELRERQAAFARTGGLHAAGLFDLDGRLLIQHEDVGRHNAVDKVVGQLLFQDDLPARDRVLLVSGRASFELLQKAALAGIPIFAAVGAPSSLAVELAVASGITLIGLLRPGRFGIYAHPERIERGEGRGQTAV